MLKRMPALMETYRSGADVIDTQRTFNRPAFELAIARVYPQRRVDEFDLDTRSVELARSNVAASDVRDRVQIRQQDVSDPSLVGQYDLVIISEALHDMSRPVEALGRRGRC